jgi:hypothetical protein
MRLSIARDRAEALLDLGYIDHEPGISYLRVAEAD